MKTKRVAVCDEKTGFVINVALYKVNEEGKFASFDLEKQEEVFLDIPPAIPGHVMVELRATDHVGPGFSFDLGKGEFFQPTGEHSVSHPAETFALVQTKTFIPLAERMKQILSLGIYSPRSQTVPV